MKRNIYQKLHDACLSAGSVKKGTKANGMHFNPLLHDDVQTTATVSYTHLTLPTKRIV